jgi:3-isopropylmalate/(R)-2-methylmalate dehydratase small subunit
LDFARIFFRSATNNALPCLRFADPADRARIRPGQRLDLDLDDCRLCTEDGDTIALEPPGAFVRMVWEAGGLIEAAKLGGMSRRPVAAPAGGEDGA